LKSTIALLVVLIGLVAYIYFVDSKKPASDAPETKAKAFTVDADQIEEIHIKPTSGDASRVAKANGTWQLIEPEKAEADQGQVSNAATSLASLEINRVVDDNPSDLSQYGLNPPKAEITFRAKGQKDTHQLLLWREDRDGQRSLCEDSGSETRLPDLGVSREHLRTDTVRPARQGGVEVRSVESRRHRDRARRDDRPCQERQRMGGDEAVQGAGRFRGRGSRADVAFVAANAEDRRERCQGTCQVRTRQA
jgi:hypothetical protein